MNRNVIAVVLVMLSVAAFGGSGERQFFESQIRYWGVEAKVSAGDVDKLVQLKQKTDAPGLTQEERTKAYEELFHFVQKVRGLPEGRVPAATAAGFWNPQQRVEIVRTAKPHQLGNFQKRGSGSVPMILIPDLGADWSVFDSFMQRNQSKFTFFAVTLSGFGDTAPPTRASKLDYSNTVWWNNAEAAILDLITNKKIDRPVILGHQAGAYLAMKVALSHPDRVRGAVVLNGLLYMAHPAIPQNATLPERAKIVNSWTPVDLFPNPTREQYRNFYRQGVSWLCKDKNRQEQLVDLLSRTSSSTWWNYFAELATTDVSNQMKNLKVSMLVLPSVYDSPDQFKGSEVGLQQWKSFDHSALPITVVPLENCRAYAMDDQPEKLDEAVRAWTVDRRL
jgi:pimeloyl-ACP methyl ester carboxylesterase